MDTSDDPDARPRSNAAVDHLFDDFEPAPLPPIAGDPTKPFDPATTQPLRRLPISICTLGPCVRYHELVAQVDAQAPLDGSGAPVHIHKIRTCYPHTGIEMQLTAPVRECNRWHPQSVSATKDHDDYTRSDAYQKNNPGKYNAFLTSWNGASFDDNQE